MLSVGDKVVCYVDDIEGYRTFRILSIENGRYTLEGIDTNTQLCRILDNTINHLSFSYVKC